MNEKTIKIQNEMEEKVEALSIENEDLKKRLEVGTSQITSIKKGFSETVQEVFCHFIQIVFCSYIPQANFNFITIFLKVN
jgi:regulator of replication initiation timing